MAKIEFTEESGRGEDCWPESWREIAFRIWVSSHGRVWWSGPPWAHKHKPGIVRQAISPSGYRTVGLPRVNRGKPIGVHRLVALGFHGQCPDGLEVDHINGRRDDNRPENLRYVTRSENIRAGWARRRAA